MELRAPANADPQVGDVVNGGDSHRGAPKQNQVAYNYRHFREDPIMTLTVVE